VSTNKIKKKSKKKSIREEIRSGDAAGKVEDRAPGGLRP
jgi:hypothetical protein